METNIFQSGGIEKAGLARPTPMFMQPEVRMDTSLITVSYAYDSLYRLTVANYSDGNFFHYTYDAAGNRLTETTRFGTNIYVYDAANRLVSVNAVNYTWDNNGNLLSDGEYTYIYDHANRLKTVTDGVNTSSYAYNGLEDRVSETVNEVTTDYVLDLAGGLTQVLAEGTNSYLYGNARIMQEDSSEEKEYFLGDALGSVRMLTDTDMAQIFAAYRRGINPITCQGEETCGFRSVDFFQTKADLGPEAMQSEPYFIYFKNYFSNGY